MSNTPNAVTDVLKVYTQHLNDVAPSSVLIQLGFMAAIAAAAILGFSILRPNNSVVYQPRAKYSDNDKKPPPISKGFFSWVRPLLETKEDLLMDTIGLDAVCFLRFLRMCRNIFVFIALLACIVLFPINISYNLTQYKGPTSWLTILTIQDVSGNWLWAHVGVTYLTSFVIFYLIWTNYASMVLLRWKWFRSDEYQNSLHSRSLLITSVLKSSQSDQGISTLLASLQIPYPTTAVHIGRRVGALPELIEKHNDTVRALEGVLGTYFRNAEKGGSEKGGEVALSQAKRPTMREGGQKVDAIDFLTQKIQRLEERIEITREQIGEKKAENYGFASFESVPFAHIVAKKLIGKTKAGSKFDLAPSPHDIIWENLTMPSGRRAWKKIVGALMLTVVFFLYLIPLFGVSVLANLSTLSAYNDFIKNWIINYSFLFSAFVGIVPPLCSIILQLILPMIMRWIISFEGVITHSQSDRSVTARYSAFLFVTQFFIFSLLGIIVQIISTIVIEITGKKSIAVIWEYLKTVPSQFQSYWVLQSTYWLTVLPLRGSSALIDMAQVLSLLIVWTRTALFGRTPREIREWTKPPEFDYPVYIANHLLIVAVGFVYTPLAPLVPLFTAFAFAISTWVYKYQLMYVCVGRVETGGRLWRVIVNRMLIAMIMMQLMMVLTIGLKTRWLYATALAPALISVLVFKIILSRKFDERFKWFIPTTEEIADLRMHTADARKHRLEKRFGHPSLQEPLFTPMLHKNVHHLLPTIYNGRVGAAQGFVDGKAVDQQTAGGLTFNLLEAHDLAFDRGAYLRERDEDEQTVTTMAALGSKSGMQSSTTMMTGDDYFNARRQDYMDRGAFAQTPDDLPYELSRMPTQGSTNAMSSSTDNLISYPPTYTNQSSQYPPPLPQGGPPSRRPSDFSQTSIPYENEKYFQGLDLTSQPQYEQTGIRRPSVDSRSGTPPPPNNATYQQNSYSPRQFTSPSPLQQQTTSPILGSGNNNNNRSYSPRPYSPHSQSPPPPSSNSIPQTLNNRQSFDFGNFGAPMINTPNPQSLTYGSPNPLQHQSPPQHQQQQQQHYQQQQQQYQQQHQQQHQQQPGQSLPPGAGGGGGYNPQQQQQQGRRYDSYDSQQQQQQGGGGQDQNYNGSQNNRSRQ